ncbi:MAG: Xaa-Pro dipeptidase [Patescibacteria group bacterium]|nr:Xaa-Pro dipeptidase [Patescibacteria group bacterium]
MADIALPQPYAEHISLLRKAVDEALARTGFDGLLIHAGTPRTYYEDDQEIPFRSNPSFAHFLPLSGPHHLLYLAAGKRPLLIQVEPEDYWYEHTDVGDTFWKEEYEIRETSTPEDAWKTLHFVGRIAYIGDNPQEAYAHGIEKDAVNPDGVLSHLYWRRSFKTPYEILCIDEANHIASHGHERARDAFFAGASELEIHEAYLEQLGIIESKLPYGTIVALNEKSAILHYQNKRLIEDGKVLLLDAGASYMGYASDITRTFLAEDCDVLFAGLVGGVDTLQRELCDVVKPGIPFPTLHHAAHVKIGDLLHSLDIIHVGGEEAVKEGLTRIFFPHGLGHFLGIQVHDVGGNQKGPEGDIVLPPSEHPKLRLTRTAAEGNVFTVEPGIYFIPILLKKIRTDAKKDLLNWNLIDRLAPLGGVRIEDNIAVTKEGNENLTRRYI